jgi:type II secretory pathway pseudopilin PulG
MLIPAGARTKPVADSRQRGQRGFSLWELSILMGMLALVIAAGFIFLKANDASQRETERQHLLAAADRAIQSFVAENGRLPCPATTAAGVENCAGGVQKGWLPFVTLGLDASAPARGVRLLRYVVYRGTSADLATLIDRFNPSRWSNYSSPPSGSYFTYSQLSVLDFCQGVNWAEAATSSAANAHILTSAGVQNIAYAMADGGQDMDGDGNAFDGPLNFLVATPGLEATTRPADAGYDDRVLARSFPDMRNAFNCPQATRSIDAIAQAVEVSKTVADLKQANLVNGIQQSINAGINTLMDVAGLALTIAVGVAGGVVMAEAVSELSAAIAGCVVLVGCAFIPTATAAVVAAGVGIGLSVSAGIAYGVAVPLNVAALAASIIATAKAGAAAPATAASPADQLAQLKTAADNAAAQATQAEADATAARNAANAALQTYNNNVAFMYYWAHQYDTNGNNDPLLQAALNAYQAYAAAALAYGDADGDAKAKRKIANNLDASATAAEADAAAHPTDVNKQAAATKLRQRATAQAAIALTAEQNAANLLITRNTAYTAAVNANAAAFNAFSSQFIFTWVPVDLPAAENSWYDDTKNNYISKNLAAASYEQAAVLARQNANSLQAAYNNMLALQATPPPTGGLASQGFAGAEAILKAADAKGAIQ